MDHKNPHTLSPDLPLNSAICGMFHAPNVSMIAAGHPVSNHLQFQLVVQMHLLEAGEWFTQVLKVGKFSIP